MVSKRKATGSDSDEDGTAKRPRNRRGAPHARGGVHRVKDEDRTNTKYDSFSGKELDIAIQARPYLYVKDARKVDRARALANDDAKLAREARAAERLHNQRAAAARIRKAEEEKRKKKQEEEREREKAAEKAERQRKRAEQGDDDEDEDDEYESESSSENTQQEILGLEQFGAKQSDTESSSSGSDTTDQTAPSPIFPHSRLRIFEWPYPDMPSDEPPQSPLSPSGGERDDVFPEPMPRKIPYAAMKLVTTNSNETLQLPGARHPPGIDADFVLRLDPYTMNCARNGIMVCNLRNAVIESGAEWAQRTQVQCWNGHMYLRLPDPEASSSLASVYTKHNKSKPKVADPITGQRALKGRAQKRKEKEKDKKQIMLDVYATSEYRPPICYSPVDLGYPFDMADDHPEEPRTLGNLFYVRFKSMDLPSYYFWAWQGDWQVPTKANPMWQHERAIDAQRAIEEKQKNDLQMQEAMNNLHVRASSDNYEERPVSLDQTKMRVPKEDVSRRRSQGSKRLPKTSKFDHVVAGIERELARHGQAVVLSKYRREWTTNGKEKHWQHLTQNMPRLYPSGKLSDTPPVHDDDDERPPTSLAEKIASIEDPSPSRPVSPIYGDEPWTRQDDEYWSVVEASSPPHHSTSSSFSNRSPKELQRKFSAASSASRRRSSVIPQTPRDKFESWLDDLRLSYASPDRANLPASSASPAITTYRALERQAWEKLFEQHVNDQAAPNRDVTQGASVSTLLARIDSMPVEELKWQVLSMMNKHLDGQFRCSICLVPLALESPEAWRLHYQSHYVEVEEQCPFCKMDWSLLDAEWKASHVFNHDIIQIAPPPSRCQSSQALLYSIPRSTGRSHRPNAINTKAQPKRDSKVKFSPQTVERRIAYNDDQDNYDTGMDGDLSSGSPHKSSLKRNGLKIDTTGRILKKKTDPKKGRVAKSKSSGKGRGRGRKVSTRVDDTEYQDTPTTASSLRTSPHDPPTTAFERGRNKRKAKKTDQTYRDALPSPPSSDAQSPVLYKRRKLSDAPYLEEPSSATSSTTPVKPAKKKSPKSKGNAKSRRAAPLIDVTPGDSDHDDSIVSNASSGSLHRRFKALQDPTPDANASELKPTAKNRRKRTTSGASTTTKGKRAKIGNPPTKRKTATNEDEEDESEYTRRRRRDESPAYSSADFIGFVDEPLFEDLEKDVLTGNPFAPLRKNHTNKVAKSKKQVATPSKSKANSKAKVPATTPKSTGKTTLSGRPFIEPILMAPAIQLSKLARKHIPWLNTIQTPTTAENHNELDTPATASSKTIPSPRIVRTSKRKISTATSSSASRPSVSFSLPSPSPTASQSESRSTRKKYPATPISTSSPFGPPTTTLYTHRASFDTPYSDTRAIVPPNTPALTPIPRRRSMLRELPREPSIGSDDVEVEALAVKIGKVKTTKGGLVKELPVAVRVSVANRAKTRGVGVRKGEGMEGQGVVVSGRVEKIVKGKVEGKGKAKRKVVTEVKTPRQTTKTHKVKADSGTTVRETKKAPLATSTVKKQAVAPKITTKKAKATSKKTVAPKSGKSKLEKVEKVATGRVAKTRESARLKAGSKAGK